MRKLVSFLRREKNSSLSRKRKFSLLRVAAIAMLLIVPALALACWLSEPPPKKYEIIKDVPGIVNPQFVAASHAGLQSDELIIGIVAFGEAKAFLRGAMGGRPENHLIHDVIGSVKVTVTHCDISGSTRIFRETPGLDLLELRCGGLTVGPTKKEMALMVGDRRVPHSSKDIPFDELPFVVTTWGEWQKAHPSSPVFLGRAPRAPSEDQENASSGRL